jgi:hypothetical protein
VRQSSHSETCAKHLRGPLVPEILGELKDAMKSALPAPIESLFMRYPALCGFSVRGRDELPDSCPPSGDADFELFVGDIGISPALSHEQFGEIFQEIVAALAELLAEEPGAGAILRGRTFARVLH